jgi:hypothetical protein
MAGLLAPIVYKVFGLPVAPETTEAPDTDLPSVAPPPPDVDIPDTAPPEITQDQSSGRPGSRKLQGAPRRSAVKPFSCWTDRRPEVRGQAFQHEGRKRFRQRPRCCSLLNR